MINKPTHTKLPKHRFPEFRDTGEWECIPLGEVLNYEQPTKYLVNDNKYDDVYQTPVLTAGKTFLLGYTDETEGIFNENLPTIIFDDFTTAFQFVDFPFKAKSSAMKMLVPATKDTNMKFVFEAMKTVKFFPEAHKRYWISEYQNKTIPYPSDKAERQKIADCLSSVDELITLQSQKLDALQKHKKGLMQQLFPIEGETLPKLRFPEFRNAGEWEKKSLGSICDYWNGASYEREITKNGNYYLISLNSIDIDGNLKSDMKRISYTDNSLQKNDLIMVLSDVAHGDFLGLTDIIPANYFVLNQRMAGLRLRDSNIGNVRFLRTYINNNQQYFKQNGQGSSQLNLTKSSVTDFPVLLPKPEEQKEIADCLSSVDELISLQSQKLDALKDHKKGLMQQLFPNPKEIVL